MELRKGWSRSSKLLTNLYLLSYNTVNIVLCQGPMVRESFEFH